MYVQCVMQMHNQGVMPCYDVDSRHSRMATLSVLDQALFLCRGVQPAVYSIYTSLCGDCGCL